MFATPSSQVNKWSSGRSWRETNGESHTNESARKEKYNHRLLDSIESQPTLDRTLTPFTQPLEEYSRDDSEVWNSLATLTMWISCPTLQNHWRIRVSMLAIVCVIFVFGLGIQIRLSWRKQTMILIWCERSRTMCTWTVECLRNTSSCSRFTHCFPIFVVSLDKLTLFRPQLVRNTFRHRFTVAISE